MGSRTIPKKKSKPAREPIAVWFRATVWFNVKVRTVQVVAFTDKTVTFLVGTGMEDDEPPFREVRHNIDTDDTHYFPSFVEAKAWCIRKAEGKVKQAHTALDHANGLLGNAKGLQEPKP